MRIVRISIQFFFFILFFVLFFWGHTAPFALNFESEFLLKFNPFVSLVTFLATHSILLSNVIIGILVVTATIFLGRVFCGFFCPLGAMIDFFDHYFFAKMRSRHRRPPLYFQRIKYVVMFTIIVLALLGALFPLYLDPLSFTSRFLAFIVDPVIKIIGTDILNISTMVFPTAASSLYEFLPSHLPLYYGILATVVTSLVIFGSGFWDRRFFCQYLCPSGAFFALLSKFTLFKRYVNSNKCNSCNRCARVCPVHAINEKNSHQTNVSECIECGECVNLKDSCTDFKVGKSVTVPVLGPNFARRHVVSGAIGGLVLAPVFRSAAINKRDDSGRTIRPPGAIPEPQFLGKCIGCGTCIKACPTNTLQPCMFNDGFNRLYTPKVVPRIAGCEEKCTLCGYVCPTGAINKLGFEEKKFVRIGTAIVDRHRCIAWEQQKGCLVCDEVCPYNAIEGREVETVDGLVRVPVVNEELCVGCGMCEQHCPVFDAAAIVIYKFGENRRLRGPYLSDFEKAAIQEKREKSDSEHFNTYPQDSGTSSGFVESDDTKTVIGEEQKLPDGFLD